MTRHVVMFAGVTLLLTGQASTAQSTAPSPEDVSAVDRCLQRAKKQPSAQVPMPGALNSRQDDTAPHKEQDCIGVVSNPCLQGDDQSTAAMVECYGREVAVWDVRLNTAYKKLMAQSEPDVAEGFRKVQRTWIAYRDATCIQPHIVYKGTMASPMGAACMLEQTGTQALWLEKWIEER